MDTAFRMRPPPKVKQRPKSASLFASAYQWERHEDNYAATEPSKAKPCSCELPGQTSEGECWKCGRPTS